MLSLAKKTCLKDMSFPPVHVKCAKKRKKSLNVHCSSDIMKGKHGSHASWANMLSPVQPTCVERFGKQGLNGSYGR
jgi:hypothetical protein